MLRKLLLTLGVTVVLGAATVFVLASGPREPAGHDKPFFRKQILIGAHRGGGSVVPENTVMGFLEAAKRWPGILMEGDAALTADGHVVLNHDYTVDRTTDGTGEINKMTLAQIKALDAGFRLSLDGGATFPYRGKGATIATLKEALEALPDSRFLIEFKPYPGIVEATIAAIREVGAEDRVLLASFRPEHMQRARELAPQMAMCYDFDNGMAMLETLRNGAWSEYTPAADVLSLMRHMVREFSLTPEEIQAVRAKGIRFQIHTVDDPEEMAMYLDMGVDSILTDRPDLLTRAVAEWRTAN